jgi:hypothetical protein
MSPEIYVAWQRLPAFPQTVIRDRKFKGDETVCRAAEINKGYGILKTVESRNAVIPDG